MLRRIATASPDQSYSQDEALRFMMTIPGYGEKERRFLERIYQSTGIDHRFSVIQDYRREPADYTFFSSSEDMLPEPTVSQRNTLFVEHARRLSHDAAAKVFAEEAALPAGEGIHPRQVTHLITVTCTGFSAPGFDQYLLQTLGLSPAVHRFHIGFMGCYAGFPALKMAHTICRADPEAVVLIADVELCSLHLQFKTEPDTMVANALFADGAAAALVTAGTTAGSAGIALHSFSTRVIPDSDGAMAWELGDVAFDMRLSAYVPRLIQQNIQEIVETTMSGLNLTREDVDLWAIHPGGRAILERAATSLELPPEKMQHSWEVLRQYGNMSSATIFYVLQRMMHQREKGTIFAAAFGPGLTVESAHMEL
jgi:predicted naringenin-chalcone synthase